MRISIRRAAAAALLCMLPVSREVNAQVTYTPMFGLKFPGPVYFAEMPGKPKTYVVVEHELGNVQVVSQQGGAWTKSLAYHVGVQNDGTHESGFLGFAFHPDFVHNRKYYISYMPPGTANLDLTKTTLFMVYEERQMDATFMKDAGVKRELFRLAKPANNHNGSGMAFGPDGYLYMGIADGGPEYDKAHYGQNKNVLFGKIIRIDVDHQDAGKAYAIPKDNPFASGGAAPEIYAIGFRNPWRWSFDPLTHDLWVGDVGQDNNEEVDVVKKGLNYGWSIFEANACQNGPCDVKTGFEFPAFTYNHTVGRCVIGGFVFRGNPASKYYGSFLAGDKVNAKMWALKLNGGGTADATALPNPPTGPSSFGTDMEGNIYMLGWADGNIYKMGGADLTPVATFAPHAGWLREKVGNTFVTQPGARLEAAAYRGGDRVAVYALGGARVADIAAGEAVTVPEGLYLLKASGSAAAADSKPDLLIVR